MPVLSAANIIQAKTGTVGGAGLQDIDVILDSPTTPGGTVTVQMYGPILWPGMPDGWNYDCACVVGSPLLWVFRYPTGAGGETSWPWHDPIGARVWAWRVIEWDATLDPISAFETYSQNSASGASVATFSSGTTPATTRAEVVSLVHHLTTHQASAPGMTLNFSGHTNGFVEQDEARLSLTAQEVASSWSLAFGDTAGATYETTATVNTTAPAAGDSYYALQAVYAAAVPEGQVPGRVMVVS
jgi:hypothetical protein